MILNILFQYFLNLLIIKTIILFTFYHTTACEICTKKKWLQTESNLSQSVWASFDYTMFDFSVIKAQRLISNCCKFYWVIVTVYMILSCIYSK